MKPVSFIIIILFFLVDCSPDDTKIPPDILPVDSMKVIVWHLIEAGNYASIMKQKDSSLKTLNTAYFTEVLKLHHLTKPAFLKSFNFYQSRPYFSSLLLDSVNEYALRQRNEIYKRVQ